ncbi:PAS domain S-box protein [Thalassobaculum sp.]|uniref:PAS domain S-box protein n=1 Tax=Thalassobaculum sp. TaxID=2022740 RepID=UPI003B5C37EE
MTVAHSILQNFGLLCLGALMMLLLTRHVNFLAAGQLRNLVFGLVLGVISVVVVASPIFGPFGSTFDTRGAPLALAGYFAGPVGGVVAASLAAVARYEVGGPYMLSGMLSVFIYAAAGAVFAEISRRRNRRRQGFLGFVVLAVVSTLASLPAFFINHPFQNGLAILSDFWPIILISNVGGIPLLGLTIEFLLEISDERDRYQIGLQTSALARQSARIGVWTHDLSSGHVTWDSVQHEVMGLPPGTFEGTHEAFMRRVVPADRSRVEEELRAAKAASAPFQLHYQIMTPDGELRHIRGHGHFVGTDGSSSPARMIGVNFDATREHELQAQVELNSAALDSAVCGVIIAEAKDDYPIVYVNSAFTAITGYTSREILGRNCRFLNQGLGDQPELEVIRRSLARGIPCTVTLSNRRKDGATFWNTLNLSPIRNRNGHITHFIGVQDDVTEQVAARQVIADGRDQLEAVLAATPDAILSVDSRQCITSFNDAAVRLFGWRQDEIIGRSIHELVPVGARRAHVDLVRNYIADPDSAPGPMSALRIVQARRKDGSSFPALISLARYLVGGQPMVSATAHDMSEIVEANEELLRLSDQLRAQLEEAYRANEAKDHFLAHMSHELRTPLNAIIGFAELISSLGLQNLSPERASEYVGDIKRSGEHLLSLINEILDLSRLKAGLVDVAIADTDARALLEEALTTVGPALAKKGIGAATDFRENGPILCDRRLTLQCLLNLLSNAAKFSPESSRITVRLFAADGGTCIAIEDQGSGVPGDILERVGEPFLRHDDPLTSNGEGSGLGLAITKSLVEKQNGRLRITNGPNGGTVASIWLPARDRVRNDENSSLEVC